MHALTRFKRFNYDAQRVTRAFNSLITDGKNKYVFMVAEGANHHVVGALIGVLEQHIFSEQPTASIMHFDVLPESRMGGYALRLLKAFEQWSANRGVAEINFGINSLDAESASSNFGFVEKFGYRPVGINYSKPLGK